MGIGLVSACGDSESKADTKGEAEENWTVRPEKPADMYAYYTPDDEANPCELSGPPPTTSGEVLVFADDFDGTQVSPDNWNVQDKFLGFAGTVNTSSAAKAVVRDGSLLLVTDATHADAGYPYVSAALDTKGRFARTYGKIEMRGRFPRAHGVWYEQMGRPWSEPYPLVKVELINRPTNDHTQLYFGQEWAATTVTDRSASTLVEDVDFSQMHTFAIVWKPDAIEWFLDGISRMRSTRGVATAPTYWTLGAWVGGWPGTPTSATPLPVSFELDYFRIYRVDGVIGEPAIAVANPKDTYFKSETLEFQLANFDEACAHVNVYEGDWRLAMRATPPYRLPLKHVSHGKHTFRFVATDGVRTGETSLTFHVN